MPRPLVAIVVAGTLAALPAAARACVNPNGGLETSRIVQIDASSGPIYGEITRYAGEPGFLKPKEIVLTFDDGPSPSITRSILAALDSYCAKATFFPVGRMATAYPSVLREVANRGHTIGAHTWTHPRNLRRLTMKSVKHQIEKGFAAVALASNTPIAPFFRFPGLNDDARALAYLKERGIATLSVDIVSDDSYADSAETLVANTLSRVDAQGSGILLFHDIKRATAEALPAILKGLKKRGYKIVHLTSKFAYTPVTTYDSELHQRLAKSRPPTLSVSLAGLQGTVRPPDPVIRSAPPVTHLAPAARKIELASARKRRIRDLSKSIENRVWSRILDDRDEASETASE